MKKLGGILATLLGAGVAAGGIFALVKGKDKYVEIDSDSVEEYDEVEYSDVEESEE